MFQGCESLISLKLENTILVPYTPGEFLALTNLCSMDIRNSDLERNVTFLEQFKIYMKEFKNLTIFVSPNNPYISNYSFLKPGIKTLYRRGDICDIKCDDGLFGTSYSSCLKVCPQDYFDETYKNISREFNNKGKTLKEIFDSSKVINDIKQCYFKFYTCKKGDPEGTVLYNKCDSNETCENGYLLLT